MRGSYNNKSSGGFRNSYNSSNFSRTNKRDDRYHGSDNYRKPLNKNVGRSSRREYETSRNSYQDRQQRDVGNNARFNERSFRSDQSKSDRRSFRTHSPMRRSRERDSHNDSRSHHSFRSSDARHRSPPVSSSSFRTRSDNRQSTGIKSRLAPPIRSTATTSRRIIRTGLSSRIIRRSDGRTGMIAKRTAPINRAKDYARKIRQARLKLSENATGSSSSSRIKSTVHESKSPKKENDKNDEEHDDDYLAIANDVNFDEEENESVGCKKEHDKDQSIKEVKESSSMAGDDEKHHADEKDANEPSTSHDDKEEKGSRHQRGTSETKEPERKSSVKYVCVHCDKYSDSSKDYRFHINGRLHLLAMRRVAGKVRMTLSRLRKIQRDKQLEIEARIKDVEKITSKYCQVCKLNFRQSKEEHRDSDDHRKIKNFLKPICKICNLQLESPMKYENHRCTIEHIRKKQRRSDGTEDEADLNDFDIGDFKTLDSIGNVDDGDNEIDMDEEQEDNASAGEDHENAGKIGIDYITKVEVNYCSLCREYLSRRDEERSIADHCKSKTHMRWYYNTCKNDDKKLTKTIKVEKEDDKKDAEKKHNGSDERKREKLSSHEVDRDADINLADADEENTVESEKFKR